MKNYEKLILIMFASQKHRKLITRRYLATLTFICSNLLNEEIIDVYDVYPDGVESEEINLYIDYLYAKSLITIKDGIITLTTKGKFYADRLLANPDNKVARTYYRAAIQLLSLKNDLTVAIAAYLYFNKFGGELKGYSWVKRIYREMKDYISLFMDNDKIKKPLKREI